MNKYDFFNFNQKEGNIWDKGWPCSPRKFAIAVGIPLIILFCYLLIFC